LVSVNAQNTNAEWQQLKKDVDALFKKKQPATGKGGTSAEEKAANKDETVKSGGATADNHVGDLAPGAKSVEADVLLPFNAGAAIIRKGTATALIDATGNFIIPFTNGLSINAGKNAGLFIVADAGVQRVINAKGANLSAGLTGLSWQFTDDGKLAYAWKSAQQTIYIDANGQKYTTRDGSSEFQEGLARMSTGGVYGYKKLKDEWAVKPQYTVANPFSGGVAWVGKADNFGQLKFSLIDTKGNEIIPFSYSIQPTDFLGGLSRVTAKNSAEFAEAYIDRKNKMVVKRTLQDIVKDGSFSYAGSGFYFGTRSMSPPHLVMDSTGRQVTALEFMQNYGVRLEASDKSLALTRPDNVPNKDAGFFYYTRFFKESGKPSYKGRFNIKTKQSLEGPFADFSLLDFDPVSRLSYAKISMGSQNGRTVYREGYMNEAGLFVIVKAEASAW